eukprot:5653520-Pyramimonas_sp.AAC.1
MGRPRFVSSEEGPEQSPPTRIWPRRFGRTGRRQPGFGSAWDAGFFIGVVLPISDMSTLATDAMPLSPDGGDEDDGEEQWNSGSPGCAPL